MYFMNDFRSSPYLHHRGRRIGGSAVISATVLALLFGLGCMVLIWTLMAPQKRTIVVAGKEKRWVSEDYWVGRGPVPLEVAAYFLMDASGQEYRVTKGTFREAEVGNALSITRRDRFWTSSFAAADESIDDAEAPE